MSTEWLIATLGAAALCACRDHACHALTEYPDDPAVAAACARRFQQNGDPRDGIEAVQAFSRAHRNEDALGLASRLLGGPRGAEARRLMARIYVQQQQLDAARALVDQALQIDQTAGDHAAAYTDAGLMVPAYFTISDFAKALQLAHIAVAEAEASGEPKFAAAALIALGSVFQAAGDDERALETYAKASSRLPPGDRADRARMLLYRGTILNNQHQPALAEPLLKQARALAIELHDPAMLLSAEVNLAEFALARRALDDAERHLAGALAAGRERGDKVPSNAILVNRSILARYRGDLASASRALDEAAAANPPPEHAWMIAHERGQIAAAAHDFDAARRSYRSAISIVETMWRTSSPEELKAPFFEERWAPYQYLFALDVEQGAPADAFATLISAQGRMFLAGAIAASASDPAPAVRVSNLRALAPLVTESPLARESSPSDTLELLRGNYVLDYFAGAGQMHLLVIDHGKVKLTPVHVDLANLERLVDDFLANQDDPRSAEALGVALIPPEVLAAAPPRFHIIPDGPLLRVPFAALVVAGSRLVEHHDVVYAPSATGLAALSTGAAAPTSGPVVFSDARNNLLHSRDETKAVVDATHAEVLIGAMATAAALREAGGASLLHIVGHSGVSRDGGFLLLADGQVSAAQILSWHIHPALVILSSCASAATERRDMWGSLAAAFVAAGSRDVVATLSSVEDIHATEFTRLFYEHHGDRDPAAVVATVQRLMIDAHRPAAAWAAFAVVGL
jgi:tetratricopeptide (TPR) repeat protein